MMSLAKAQEIVRKFRAWTSSGLKDTNSGETINLLLQDADRFVALVETEDEKRLGALLDDLEPDAIRVLRYLAERLLVGQKSYGRLDLTTDPRDWKEEIKAEVGDLLVYFAFEHLKRAFSPVGLIEARAVQRSSRPVEDLDRAIKIQQGRHCYSHAPGHDCNVQIEAPGVPSTCDCPCFACAATSQTAREMSSGVHHRMSKLQGSRSDETED